MTRAQNKFSSLSLSTDKVPPHCYVLFVHLSFVSFLSYSIQEPLRPVQAYRTGEQFCLLRGRRQFSCKGIDNISMKVSVKRFILEAVCTYISFRPVSAIWETLDCISIYV